MQAILSISIPFFGLIFCGYGARRWNLLQQPAVVGLNAFVFWFALPALLFYKLATTPEVTQFEPGLLIAYSGAGLIVFALGAVGVALFFRANLAESGIAGMAAAYPNVGYMGLPLVLQIWGDAILVPAVMIMLADTLIFFTLTMLLLEAGSGKGQSVGGMLRRVGLGLARNPMIVAAFLGILWWQLRLPIPLPVAGLLGMLAAAAAPCALFALGATLVGQPMSEDRAEVSYLVFLKLIMHPFLAGFFAGTLLEIEPRLVHLAVIEASLPTAAGVFVIATAYGRRPRRVSAVVLLSTAIGVVTVSVVVALAAADPGSALIPLAK